MVSRGWLKSPFTTLVFWYQIFYVHQLFFLNNRSSGSGMISGGDLGGANYTLQQYLRVTCIYNHVQLDLHVFNIGYI